MAAAAAVQLPVAANHRVQLSISQQSFKLKPLSLTTSSSSRPSAAAATQTRGCDACGREEVEKGCNGEGRIQGGIATVPGFGWWPIKAYRPCPGLVASGGRYKRYGQSMDEVGFGRAEMGMAKETKDET